MDTYEKINKLLIEQNKTKTNLANYLEISPQRLNNWLKRKSIPAEYLKDIANFFNVDVDFLVGNKVPQTHYLPLIGSASCGVPNHSFYEEYEMIPVPESLYKENRYFVRADGDSMLPKIKNGDEVLCDADVHINNGDIVHYTINSDESGIKKVVLDETGKVIMLVPLNENQEFKPIFIKPDDVVVMNKCIKVYSDL